MAVTMDPEVKEPAQKPRYLHVKVVDQLKEDHAAVNVRVPIGLVRWGMKVAQTFSPEMKSANIDWESLASAIEEGERGEIAHVENETEHKIIDVWTE